MGIGWYFKTIGPALKRFWKENTLRLTWEEWWLNVAIANVEYSLHETLSLKDRLSGAGRPKVGPNTRFPSERDFKQARALQKLETFLEEKGALRRVLRERREDVRELRALRVVDKTRRKAMKLGVVSLPQPEGKDENLYIPSMVTGELRLNANGIKKVRENIRQERNARLEPVKAYVELVTKLSRSSRPCSVSSSAGSHASSARR